MSSQFSSYWKIITPASRKQLYTTISTDAFDPRTTDMTSMAAVSWYSQVMRGPGSRMATYKQYDAMDADIDIARSLDIIAEEMSGKDDKTSLPFEIHYQKEDNQDISDTTTITLRQAVRQWGELQEMNRRLFGISRALIKYGDCFFKKLSDTKRWVWIDPLLVYGIEIDQHGNKLNYYLKKPGKVGATAGSSGFGGGVPAGLGRNDEMEIIPAAAMIHFSMSDEMGDSAPFGASVLRPIHRVYRQLSMIEDAVIIYRIVRAPERRVFYVDVGNMPAQRVKTYLEQIKNELRQKRVPGMSNNGQKDVVDGQYDPQCLTLDTKIPLLDGRTLSLQNLISEHENGKQNWTLSCHPVTGEIKPGRISWAGKTRLDAQIVKITLDNGETITCTPDHQLPVLGEGFYQALDLKAGQSLISVVPNYNHKVISVEFLDERQDTGCITISDELHDWHTFPTAAGVFVKNSIQEDIFMPVTAAGRGSRVETLPGGAEDFGTNLLKYFQDKIFRGLRIPTSYMGGADGQGAQYNDGKVGIAYIEELRFAKFVMRLQERINKILDEEFKVYLKVVGLKIDDEVFNIRLPDPANFALYRQAALDADLISSFNNIEQTKYLSKRFILKRYLGLSDDELQMNEAMIKEERGILENTNIPSMQQLYDPSVFENREQLSVEAPTGPSGDELGGLGGQDDIGGFFNAPGADTAPGAPPTTGDQAETPPPPEQ